MYTYIYTHMHIYTHIYTYLCIYMKIDQFLYFKYSQTLFFIVVMLYTVVRNTEIENMQLLLLGK